MGWEGVSPELRAQIDRVRKHVADAELAGLCKELADRYDLAEGRKESADLLIRARIHQGKHAGYRWSGDIPIMPRP